MTSPFASNDLVRAFIDGALLPVIRKLESETGQRVNLIVREYSAKVPASVVSLPSDTDGETISNAEVRVSFSHAFPVGIMNFVAQAVIRDLRTETGFSGFCLRGSATNDRGNWHAESDSCTMCYNVWDWHADLA